jgi:dCMP deaminase
MLTSELEKTKRYTSFYMELAERVAKMSHAKRLQVGSVLVKDDNVISFGWNGMPSGWDNTCEETEVLLKEECTHSDDAMRKDGFQETASGWIRSWSKKEVLHSEANCLMKVARSTNSSKDSVLYTTHAPCIDCAKLIYQAGITKVYYRNAYRSTDGIKFLEKCKVGVENV